MQNMNNVTFPILHQFHGDPLFTVHRSGRYHSGKAQIGFKWLRISQMVAVCEWVLRQILPEKRGFW
jgi:hypothetical protein